MTESTDLQNRLNVLEKSLKREKVHKVLIALLALFGLTQDYVVYLFRPAALIKNRVFTRELTVFNKYDYPVLSIKPSYTKDSTIHTEGLIEDPREPLSNVSVLIQHYRYDTTERGGGTYPPREEDRFAWGEPQLAQFSVEQDAAPDADKPRR